MHSHGRFSQARSHICIGLQWQMYIFWWMLSSLMHIYNHQSGCQKSMTMLSRICHSLQLRKHVCLILVDFFIPCMSTDSGVLVICIFVSYRWFMELFVVHMGMCTYLKKLGVHNSVSDRLQVDLGRRHCGQSFVVKNNCDIAIGPLLII